jgi:hypothetical protein
MVCVSLCRGMQTLWSREQSTLIRLHAAASVKSAAGGGERRGHRMRAVRGVWWGVVGLVGWVGGQLVRIRSHTC